MSRAAPTHRQVIPLSTGTVVCPIRQTLTGLWLAFPSAIILGLVSTVNSVLFAHLVFQVGVSRSAFLLSACPASGYFARAPLSPTRPLFLFGRSTASNLGIETGLF